MGFCFYQHPIYYDQYGLKDFAISAATHTYRWTHDPNDPWWDCTHDSSNHWSLSDSTVGFTGGKYLVVQGEAHQYHVQIGRNAPAKLSFTNLTYRLAGTTTWPVLNVTLEAVQPPYGVSEPQAGQMMVWTNAH